MLASKLRAGGYGWGHAKKDLLEAILTRFATERERARRSSSRVRSDSRRAGAGARGQPLSSIGEQALTLHLHGGAENFPSETSKRQPSLSAPGPDGEGSHAEKLPTSRQLSTFRGGERRSRPRDMSPEFIRRSRDMSLPTSTPRGLLVMPKIRAALHIDVNECGEAGVKLQLGIDSLAPASVKLGLHVVADRPPVRARLVSDGERVRVALEVSKPHSFGVGASLSVIAPPHLIMKPIMTDARTGRDDLLSSIKTQPLVPDGRLSLLWLRISGRCLTSKDLAVRLEIVESVLYDALIAYDFEL